MLLKMEYFQPFWCYVDEQSVEETTNVCKRKYKLFINRMPLIQEVLYFFVSTSKDYTNHNLTFSVTEKEWLYLIKDSLTSRPTQYLSGCSHFDIRKICTENESDLMNKRKHNHLACVAYLPDTKQHLMRKCFENLRYQRLNPKEKTNLKDVSDILSHTVSDKELQNFFATFNI